MKESKNVIVLAVIMVVIFIYNVARAVAQYWNGTTLGMILHAVFAVVFLGMAIKLFVTWRKIRDLSDDD